MKVFNLLFIITMCLKILRSSTWRHSPDQSTVVRCATEVLPSISTLCLILTLKC